MTNYDFSCTDLGGSLAVGLIWHKYFFVTVLARSHHFWTQLPYKYNQNTHTLLTNFHSNRHRNTREIMFIIVIWQISYDHPVTGAISYNFFKFNLVDLCNLSLKCHFIFKCLFISKLINNLITSEFDETNYELTKRHQW